MRKSRILLVISSIQIIQKAKNLFVKMGYGFHSLNGVSLLLEKVQELY